MAEEKEKSEGKLLEEKLFWKFPHIGKMAPSIAAITRAMVSALASLAPDFPLAPVYLFSPMGSRIYVMLDDMFLYMQRLIMLMR